MVMMRGCVHMIYMNITAEKTQNTGLIKSDLNYWCKNKVDTHTFSAMHKVEGQTNYLCLKIPDIRVPESLNVYGK